MKGEELGRKMGKFALVCFSLLYRMIEDGLFFWKIAVLQ